MVNGDFGTGDLTNWHISKGNWDCRHVRVVKNHDQLSGDYALLISNNEDGEISQRVGPLVEGQRYRISAWVRDPSSNPIHLQVTDTGSKDKVYVDDLKSIPPSPWQEIQFDFTAGTKFAYVSLFRPGSVTTAGYVDNVQFRRITEPNASPSRDVIVPGQPTTKNPPDIVAT